MPDEISNLLIGFWRDLQQPDLLWQIGALVVSLLLGWYAAHLTHRHKPAAGESRFSHDGLKRLAFPLVALVAVLLLREGLRPWLHLHLHLLSLAVPLLASLAVIRIVFYILRYSLGHTGWIAAVERSFALLVWLVVALYIMGWLPELIDMMEGVHFAVGKQKLDLWLLLQGLATVLATLLLALWLSGLVEARLKSAAGLDANLRVVFARLTKALAILIAILIGLPLVGIDLTTLSVFGGALGVGLGFGLQKIASNYVSGFIILLDRSIRIGDVISVGAERGQVTQITTRYTVLKAANGIEAIVPNETLVASVVRNESLTDPRMRIAMPISVAYGSDVEQAMSILRSVATQQASVLADPGPATFVISFAESGINLELGFWIANPPEGSQQISSEIYLAIWREFQAAGIEIPLPQRELRFKNALETGVVARAEA